MSPVGVTSVEPFFPMFSFWSFLLSPLGVIISPGPCSFQPPAPHQISSRLGALVWGVDLPQLLGRDSDFWLQPHLSFCNLSVSPPAPQLSSQAGVGGHAT